MCHHRDAVLGSDNFLKVMFDTCLFSTSNAFINVVKGQRTRMPGSEPRNIVDKSRNSDVMFSDVFCIYLSQESGNVHICALCIAVL